MEAVVVKFKKASTVEVMVKVREVAVVNETEATIKRRDEQRLSGRLWWTCLNIFVRVREREFSVTRSSEVALHKWCVGEWGGLVVRMYMPRVCGYLLCGEE